MLLPATPGWVSLPVVVGVPRHSWLRVLGAVPRHSWLGSAGGGGVRLPVTPCWGPPVVVVCFAGGGVPFCVCLWCVWVCAVAVLCCVLRVCGVCVIGGVVWWCGGCVFRVCWCAWLRVCGVPVVCGLVFPPLATPDRGPWAWFPATPGRGPLVVVVRAPGALLLGLGVCVCAVWPLVLVWVGRGGSCAVRLPCVCVFVLAVCGWWGVSYLGWFSLSVGMVVFKKQKKRSCRRVAEMCGMRDAYYVPLYLSHRVFFPCRERACAGLWGVGWLFLRFVLCVSPPFSFVASSITYLFALRFPYREGVEGAFVCFVFSVTYLSYLV